MRADPVSLRALVRSSRRYHRCYNDDDFKNLTKNATLRNYTLLFSPSGFETFARALYVSLALS